MFKKNKFNVDTFPFIPIAVFLVAIIYFWKKFVGIFKSDDYVATIETPVTQKNQSYLSAKRITADGKFITGTGVVTKYTIQQARQDAEELSSILNTGKNSSWYNTALNFSFSPNVKRVKAILNRGYPASYRRYVQETYRDIFTNKKDLQPDVRNAFTGFAGTSFWDENLTAYFIL